MSEYDRVGMVFRILVRDSLIPSDPHRVGAAALVAIRRHRPAAPAALPGTFGSDVERDASWLASVAPHGDACWSVLEAMAWASDAPHTALTDGSFAAGMAAMLRGEPRVCPGFFVCRQGDGRLAVVDVDPRGAAHAAGLVPGDVLASVDGRAAQRASSEVLPLYAAEPGARFALRIDREGVEHDVDLELGPCGGVEGDGVRVPSVVASGPADGVGHLRVRWFAASEDPVRDTATLARRALSSMAARGARGVVVDLRSGIGGQVDAVAGIASIFTDAPVIAAHRYPGGRESDHGRVGAPAWLDARVVVLANEQTISAAELLALALVELAGARLVGTSTAGGLNGIDFVDLGDGYRLAVPHGPAIGPRSRATRPGHRMVPHVEVPNPTVEELRSGVDPQLAHALWWAAEG